MKKPSNKAIAIYLIWILLHLTLLSAATPGIHNRRFFFPFSYKNTYVRKPFTIDCVYDFSELIFYTIAPILIYYIITLFKTKDEADK